MRRRVSTYGFCLLMLAAATPAFGQRTTGEIIGTVTDESGAVLPGVTVTLRGAGVGGAPTVVTTETGAYRFPALPPGSYDVEYSLQGFGTLRNEAIPVGVGSTVELKATLKVSTLSETVTVTGESPVVNLASSQVSTNYNREWVVNAPLRRFSFFDLVNSAPGVSATSNLGSSTSATSLGGTTNDNVYQIDGTDLSAPTGGTAWPWPNTDAIQEIEVLQLGASAEYGNVMGAVFNVVTRQGSNAFHGDGSYYFQNQSLTARNTSAAVDAGLPYHRAKWVDTTWQLSGPFIKDKFWFFGSFQYQQDHDSQPGTDANFPALSDSKRVFYKFTYNISTNHRLMHGYHDDYWSFPSVPTAFTAPSTIGLGHGDNPTPNLVYTGVLSGKTFVEARLAGYYGKDSTDPQEAGEPRVLTRFNNLDNGQITGGISSWSDAKTWRTGASGKISHFADRFLGGSHDLKLGVQYNGGGRDAVTGPNDYIYITGGKQSYGYSRLPWHSGGLIRTTGAYADDTYRVGSRATLNLGLRYDHSKAMYQSFPVLDPLGNPTGQFSVSNDDVYHWNVVSPRVGINYKVNESGKTIVKAHYGRYYRGVLLNDFTAAVPSVTPRYEFDIDARGNRSNFTVVSSNANLRIDSGYKDPYTDQFIAQIEQELTSELGLQVNYVHKQGYDYPGWQDVVGQYTQVPYVDSRGTDASGQTISVYKLLTPSAQSVFLMTNPGSMYSRYNGVAISANKRLSHNWQGTFSIVLSKSEGREPSSTLGPSSGQSGTSGSFGRFPNGINDFVNTDGLLLADRPVVAKAQVVYNLPWGLTVSGNLQHQTGRLWARQIRVSGLGFPTSPTVYMEPLNGNRRVPNSDFIDSRVQKSFRLTPQGLKVDLFLDALNLTNADAYENVGSRLGTSSAFGQARNFTFPRRLMFGARFVF
jgi:hypothetical protein